MLFERIRAGRANSEEVASPLRFTEWPATREFVPFLRIHATIFLVKKPCGVRYFAIYSPLYTLRSTSPRYHDFRIGTAARGVSDPDKLNASIEGFVFFSTPHGGSAALGKFLRRSYRHKIDRTFGTLRDET